MRQALRMTVASIAIAWAMIGCYSDPTGPALPTASRLVLTGTGARFGQYNNREFTEAQGHWSARIEAVENLEVLVLEATSIQGILDWEWQIVLAVPQSAPLRRGRELTNVPFGASPPTITSAFSIDRWGASSCESSSNVRIESFERGPNGTVRGVLVSFDQRCIGLPDRLIGTWAYRAPD